MKSCLELNRMIREKELFSLRQMDVNRKCCPDPIWLHINSYGGLIDAAMSTVNTIQRCSVPIHTVVDGAAASAGTIISVVGDKRYIGRNSKMLIHQISGGMWGNYEQMIDDAKNNDLYMKQIIDIYLDYTEIKKKKLKEILKRDLYFSPKKCLKVGLVDEILD